MIGITGNRVAIRTSGAEAPRRRLLLRASVAAFALALGGAWTGIVSADVGCYRCADPSKVYMGNPRLFQKPAVISADRVYQQIPEYREILDSGLTDKDVRYHFLMKKASERFTKAVKSMARGSGHDLVAEIGAVEAVRGECPEPPDRTSEVIDNLS